LWKETHAEWSGDPHNFAILGCPLEVDLEGRWVTCQARQNVLPLLLEIAKALASFLKIQAIELGWLMICVNTPYKKEEEGGPGIFESEILG
jgi:hypothetical protein